MNPYCAGKLPLFISSTPKKIFSALISLIFCYCLHIIPFPTIVLGILAHILPPRENQYFSQLPRNIGTLLLYWSWRLFLCQHPLSLMFYSLRWLWLNLDKRHRVTIHKRNTGNCQFNTNIVFLNYFYITSLLPHPYGLHLSSYGMSLSILETRKIMDSIVILVVFDLFLHVTHAHRGPKDALKLNQEYSYSSQWLRKVWVRN